MKLIRETAYSGTKSEVSIERAVEIECMFESGVTYAPRNIVEMLGRLIRKLNENGSISDSDVIEILGSSFYEIKAEDDVC